MSTKYLQKVATESTRFYICFRPCNCVTSFLPAFPVFVTFTYIGAALNAIRCVRDRMPSSVRCGLAHSRCLVVEDSMVGLRAAKAAQMRCLITYTSSTVQEDFYAEVCPHQKLL